jgi:hypothetical protein
MSSRPWVGHGHVMQFDGECEPNDVGSMYGLLHVRGPAGQMREIIARFRDRKFADAACAQCMAEGRNPDERYEVIALG